MPFNQRSSFAKYAGPQKKPVIDTALLSDLSDHAVRENQACARKVALAAEIWDSCIHQTIQVGDLIMDAGNYAASKTAKVLGCSKTVADTFAEIGMDLRLRLPAVKEAFESGELDLARVRAIYRVTGSLSLAAAQRIEAEVLYAARRLSPGPLASEISGIIARTAPDEMAEVREDMKKLTGVRYRDNDIVATIEANLEAADAAACWQSISEMAATLCPRDPRTRSQRLAAAYIACMQREEHLKCTCEVDEDHPCTANRELPDRRVPLTSITIDLATLAGLNELPAFLAGHGLIDAEYARELAANSDWQIVITEARNVADELHISLDDSAHDSGSGEGAEREGTESEGGPVTTGGRDSGNHLTFHPLGRGRRRRGLRIPKTAVPTPLSNTDSARQGENTGKDTDQYKGSYTLIAALEKAIAANPSIAAPLYPDGQGGFIEPPDGALRYRPRKELADLVRHRDRTCRFPGCDVPAASCELDHVVPYFHHDPVHGGWTILTNLHCLCRYHHSLETMGAWRPAVLAGAIEYWESNSGSTAVTLPGSTAVTLPASTAVTLPGSTVGTTDLAGETLTPHIPRERRQTRATETPDEKASAQKGGGQKDATDRAQTDTNARPKPTTCWSMKISCDGRADADDPAPF